MTQAVAKTALTGCLAPIDKTGLDELIAKGKADPKVIKTLKCKTVAEGRFRHLNFIRSLPAYVVDEPPGLLGDDTAPNSVGSLACGSRLLSCRRDPRKRGGARHHRLQARDRTGRRSQHHRRVGYRRSVRQACRLHRRAREGGVRGRPSARGARSADRTCTGVVASGQHLHATGQSRRELGLTRTRSTPASRHRPPEG